MISFERACEIATAEKEKNFTSLGYVSVTELEDRWAFIYSAYSQESGQYSTIMPKFFVYKHNGEVEPFSIPPLENLRLLRKGKTCEFV